MKKKIIIALLTVFLLMPLFTKAAVEKKNLKEALNEEGISLSSDFSNYKETSDQAIIYLFRGNGCGYCRAFLTFLNSIVGDYGKYFKVVSYEVWYNEDNANILNKVSTYLDGEAAAGVPYIVIGDKTFGGYTSSWDGEIKDAIKKLYNTSISERYDVFDEMNGTKKEEPKKEEPKKEEPKKEETKKDDTPTIIDTTSKTTTYGNESATTDTSTDKKVKLNTIFIAIIGGFTLINLTLVIIFMAVYGSKIKKTNNQLLNLNNKVDDLNTKPATKSKK